MGNPCLFVDIEENLLSTGAIALADFDPPPVYLSGSYSDVGVDIDADGLFDQLLVTAGVEVATAGVYTVTAALEGAGGANAPGDLSPAVIASSGGFLGAGTGTVAIPFDGEAIANSRQDGPYWLKAIAVEDGSNMVWHSIKDAHQTGAYSDTDFEHAPIRVDVTSDQAIDYDSYLAVDTGLDYLQVGLDVSGVPATEAHDYTVRAILSDPTGEPVSVSEKGLGDPASAASASTIEFPGGDIRSYGVDDSFVVSVSVENEHGMVVDVSDRVYETAVYNAGMFAMPLAEATGTYTETAIDVDVDGQFEYLDIEVEVALGREGTVQVSGTLVDSAGGEIESVQAALIVTVTPAVGDPLSDKAVLRFSGELIRANQQNGPFTLREVFVFHSGARSAVEADFIGDAYSTAPYGWQQFGQTSLLASVPSFGHVAFLSWEWWYRLWRRS